MQPEPRSSVVIVVLQCLYLHVVVVVVVVVRRRRRRQLYIDENRCIPRVTVLLAGPLAAFTCLLSRGRFLVNDKLKRRDECRILCIEGSDIPSLHAYPSLRGACVHCDDIHHISLGDGQSAVPGI